MVFRFIELVGLILDEGNGSRREERFALFIRTEDDSAGSLLFAYRASPRAFRVLGFVRRRDLRSVSVLSFRQNSRVVCFGSEGCFSPGIITLSWRRGKTDTRRGRRVFRRGKTAMHVTRQEVQTRVYWVVDRGGFTPATRETREMSVRGATIWPRFFCPLGEKRGDR